MRIQRLRNIWNLLFHLGPTIFNFHLWPYLITGFVPPSTPHPPALCIFYPLVWHHHHHPCIKVKNKTNLFVLITYLKIGDFPTPKRKCKCPVFQSRVHPFPISIPFLSSSVKPVIQSHFLYLNLQCRQAGDSISSEQKKEWRGH